MPPTGASPSNPNERTGEKRAGLLTRILRGDWWRRKQPTPEPTSVGSTFERLRNRHDVPSDWLLISRCRTILCTDRELTGSGIHVDARDGTVYLRGSVPDERLRERADRLARQTQGARAVVNQLSVVPAIPLWMGMGGVQLAMPRPMDEPWRPAAPSGSPGTDASAKRPAGSMRRKIAPDDSSTSRPAATPEATRPGDAEGAAFWQSVIVAESLRGAVVLGPPEMLSSRLDLPGVITYVVRRSTPQVVQPVGQVLSRNAPSSIPYSPRDWPGPIGDPFAGTAVARSSPMEHAEGQITNPLASNGVGWSSGNRDWPPRNASFGP
jgi:hypothetical protein